MRSLKNLRKWSFIFPNASAIYTVFSYASLPRSHPLPSPFSPDGFPLESLCFCLSKITHCLTFNFFFKYIFLWYWAPDVPCLWECHPTFDLSLPLWWVSCHPYCPSQYFGRFLQEGLWLLQLSLNTSSLGKDHSEVARETWTLIQAVSDTSVR